MSINTKLINHVFMIVDASGSMADIGSSIVKNVFKSHIEEIKNISVKMGQETRASLYTFRGGGNWSKLQIDVEAFDIDVMRLPTLDSYRPDGGTPLMDCVSLALKDKCLISEKYGDHAFVFYILTDGEENTSTISRTEFKEQLRRVNACENVTLLSLVPNIRSRTEMVSLGFDVENVRIWDVSAKGLVKEQKIFTSSTQKFFEDRTRGIKKSANYFNLDETKLTAGAVKANFKPLDPATYVVLNVNFDTRMDDFQTANTGNYVAGAGYYQLTKKEFVQPQKHVLIREKKTGKVFDAANSREILGLPKTLVKINPIDNPLYDVFIQSTANNRKLLKGTQCLILK